MKSPLTATLVALFTLSGGFGLPGSSVSAQDKTRAATFDAAIELEPSADRVKFPFNKTGVYSPTFEVPYYLIQVEYARQARPHGSHGHGSGGYGGGRNEGRPRYTYTWVTIAESTDLEEAEFIYALFNLAWEQGVLDEVAPDLAYFDFPTRVRMITEYRTVDPVLSAE